MSKYGKTTFCDDLRFSRFQTYGKEKVPVGVALRACMAKPPAPLACRVYFRTSRGMREQENYALSPHRFVDLQVDDT